MIKLGTVPFVNAKPLIYPLEKGLIEHSFDIVYEVPSKLSKKLFNREIDLGLIPVAELIKQNSYKVVKNISISSFGSVDSVVLISKSNIKSIETVAVDSRSQSSTALLKIILQIFYGLSPKYIERDHGENFLSDVDGGMLIGDTGLRFLYSENDSYKIYDLGKLWTDYTGLPFVYAVFAVNKDVDLGKNLDALCTSKSLGLNLAEEISNIEHKQIGVSKEFCYSYISGRIGYDLGEKEIEGILSFSNFLCELGISQKITELDFYI